MAVLQSVKPLAVIGYVQRQQVGHIGERDVDNLCFGMLFDVVQRFLGNTKQGSFNRFVEGMGSTSNGRFR